MGSLTDTSSNSVTCQPRNEIPTQIFAASNSQETLARVLEIVWHYPKHCKLLYSAEDCVPDSDIQKYGRERYVGKWRKTSNISLERQYAKSVKSVFLDAMLIANFMLKKSCISYYGSASFICIEGSQSFVPKFSYHLEFSSIRVHTRSRQGFLSQSWAKRHNLK